MKKFVAILAVATLAVGGTTMADAKSTAPVPQREQKPVYLLMGGGVWPCSKFNNDRRTEAFEDMYFQWAQGFMSAVNATSANDLGKYVDLNALTIGEQKSTLRTYCKQHPEERYTKAVWHLLEQMPIMDYHKEGTDEGADNSGMLDKKPLAERPREEKL
jgi:hypothetical protein